MQIAYDSAHTFLGQLSREACQNLNCFGHLLRVVLALGGWQHFSKESRFELQKAIFNQLLT
jgi:hypothetical protein